MRIRATKDDTYSDTRGKKGTVICFHGNGGSGSAWSKASNSKGSFCDALIAAGFSVVCPTAKNDKWDATNSPKNPDIEAVNRVLKHLNVKRPFFLIGHSNGGGFVSRFAVYSGNTISAVQYSNSSGIQNLLEDKKYKVPSRFAFSQADPVSAYSDIVEGMGELIERGIEVEPEDLTAIYAAGGYKNDHEFVDTAINTIDFFLNRKP
jgi:pimeloyl-ACP methyl ester carboxylesterase